MKINKEMDEKTLNQVTEYVYKNYKLYKNKQLIVREYDKCFHVLTHKDGSPLVLGRKILL